MPKIACSFREFTNFEDQRWYRCHTLQQLKDVETDSHRAEKLECVSFYCGHLSVNLYYFVVYLINTDWCVITSIVAAGFLAMPWGIDN